jgi:hypothetical protein
MKSQNIAIKVASGETFDFPLYHQGKTNPEQDKNIERITTNLTELVDKLTKLVAPENLHTAEWGHYYVSCEFSNHNKAFDEFIEQTYYPGLPGYRSYSDKKSAKHRRISRTIITGKLITLKYGATGYFDINTNMAFRKLANSLLPESEHIVDATITRNKFNKVIDKVTNAIDALLLAEGLEASVQNRSNLVSLSANLSANLTKNKKVNALLGTTHETHNIANPALVQAAAKGYTDSLIKLFYIENYFPKDEEEVETFMGIPFSMAKTIIGDN